MKKKNKKAFIAGLCAVTFLTSFVIKNDEDYINPQEELLSSSNTIYISTIDKKRRKK
jgi:hypothetical protein